LSRRPVAVFALRNSSRRMTATGRRQRQTADESAVEKARANSRTPSRGYIVSHPKAVHVGMKSGLTVVD
jgi:hypothetical protein